MGQKWLLFVVSRICRLQSNSSISKTPLLLLLLSKHICLTYLSLLLFGQHSLNCFRTFSLSLLLLLFFPSFNMKFTLPMLGLMAFAITVSAQAEVMKNISSHSNTEWVKKLANRTQGCTKANVGVRREWLVYVPRWTISVILNFPGDPCLKRLDSNTSTLFYVFSQNHPQQTLN